MIAFAYVLRMYILFTIKRVVWYSTHFCNNSVSRDFNLVIVRIYKIRLRLNIKFTEGFLLFCHNKIFMTAVSIFHKRTKYLKICYA